MLVHSFLYDAEEVESWREMLLVDDHGEDLELVILSPHQGGVVADVVEDGPEEVVARPIGVAHEGRRQVAVLIPGAISRRDDRSLGGRIGVPRPPHAAMDVVTQILGGALSDVDHRIWHLTRLGRHHRERIQGERARAIEIAPSRVDQEVAYDACGGVEAFGNRRGNDGGLIRIGRRAVVGGIEDEIELEHCSGSRVSSPVGI